MLEEMVSVEEFKENMRVKSLYFEIVYLPRRSSTFICAACGFVATLVD